MKKLLCSLVLLGMAASASAVPYLAIEADDVWLNSSYTSHTWTFDLDNMDLAVGDIGAEDTIDSAFFSIDFFDDDCDNRSIFCWFPKKEYGNLIVDGNTWYDGVEIDNGNDDIYFANVTGSLIDHVLSVTVERVSGDFGVDFTSLAGQYTDNPAAVPEPSTLALLGLGLFGLGMSRRKLSA